MLSTALLQQIPNLFSSGWWSMNVVPLAAFIASGAVVVLQLTFGNRLKRDYYRYELFHRYKTQALKNVNDSLFKAIHRFKGAMHLADSEELAREQVDIDFKVYSKLQCTLDRDRTYLDNEKLEESIQFILNAIYLSYNLHFPDQVRLGSDAKLQEPPSDRHEVLDWVNNAVVPESEKIRSKLKHWFQLK